MSDVIERAKAALVGVTDGPWFSAEEIDGMYAGRWTVVKAATPGYHPFTRVVTVGQTRQHITADGQAERNVTFIVDARTLVPELIAELESLRAEKARAIAEGDWA